MVEKIVTITSAQKHRIPFLLIIDFDPCLIFPDAGLLYLTHDVRTVQSYSW